MKSLRPGGKDVGWTLDTLYAHFDAMLEEQERRHREILASMDLRYQQRFDAQATALDVAFLAAEKAVASALQSAEKAVSKAEMASEKRFESVNEFRATLSDQATQFITRGEAETGISNLRERVQELADRINRSEGRGSGLNAGWVYLLAAMGAIGTIVSVYLALAQ